MAKDRGQLTSTQWIWSHLIQLVVLCFHWVPAIYTLCLYSHTLSKHFLSSFNLFPSRPKRPIKSFVLPQSTSAFIQSWWPNTWNYVYWEDIFLTVAFKIHPWIEAIVQSSATCLFLYFIHISINSLNIILMAVLKSLLLLNPDLFTLFSC